MTNEKIKIYEVSVNLLSNKSEWNNEDTAIIFLHGFTGNSKDWHFIFSQLEDSYFSVAIDLIGHGESDSPKELSFYNENFQHRIIESAAEHFGFDKFILAGYSMGGRLALGYTIYHPASVDALILESTTAGINDTIQREERRIADKDLADSILSNGVDPFIKSWLKKPIFSSLKNTDDGEYKLLVKNKLRNNKIGLSNSLLGFSTGVMNSYWNRISEIKCKTLLIAGELDSKFLLLNKQMSADISSSQLKVIKNCGHNAHLEKPDEFVILINNFLKNLK